MNIMKSACFISLFVLAVRKLRVRPVGFSNKESSHLRFICLVVYEKTCQMMYYRERIH